MGTPDLVWKVLALLSLVWTAIFLLPCLLKCVKYPHKAREEQAAGGGGSGPGRAAFAARSRLHTTRRPPPPLYRRPCFAATRTCP